MVKVKKYLGTETYMFPSSTLATPEIMLQKYPAILTFTHIIETDEAGQVCWAVENLSAIRSMMGIDATLTEDEAILEIEKQRNAPLPTPEPDANERIAAALEYQNMLSL